MVSKQIRSFINSMVYLKNKYYYALVDINYTHLSRKQGLILFSLVIFNNNKITPFLVNKEYLTSYTFILSNEISPPGIPGENGRQWRYIRPVKIYVIIILTGFRV